MLQGDYDTFTTILLVIFVLSCVVMAGLILRENLVYSLSGSEPTDPGQPSLEGSGSTSTEVDTVGHQSTADSNLPQWINQSSLSNRLAMLDGVESTLLAVQRAGDNADLQTGLALYTPAYRERFLQETRLVEKRLALLTPEQPNAGGDAPPAFEIESFEMISRDRIVVRIDYPTRSSRSASEQVTLELDSTTGRWFIDEITALPT